MPGATATQKPSNPQIKERCEAYLTLLEKITNEKDTVQASRLKTQADEMYATFTPKMQDYCTKRLQQEAVRKDIEERVARLEQIDHALGKMADSTKSFTEKLQGMVKQQHPPPMLVKSPNSEASSSSSGAITSAAASLEGIQERVEKLAVKPSAAKK